MNTLIHIILIGLTATLFSIILKHHKPELAITVSMAGVVIIFLNILPMIQEAISSLKNISSVSGIEGNYIELIIRVIAIAYVTELGAGLAKDAGEGALATKVELGGKIIIFTLCLPTLITLIQTVAGLMI